MIGERKNIHPDTDYGDLAMRAFDIDGNAINAFYDAQENLVFVLDNTVSSQKPNVLLVINPEGDKKWDEILSNKYGVDLETIRPKVDNKYQKLDIEYSGLSVYEKLINAYNAGDDLEEELNQLSVLRDSAARHSAMTRLNVANETITKTNATIVKTKETILRLETRIKTLRSNLGAEKKSIGKVNTKQSASKILKLESQIEATNEKLKRAKKRLESAQRRLEAATVDAELASDLLNQPSVEVKQKSKPVAVVQKYPVQTIEAKEENADDEMADEGGDEMVEDVKGEVQENDVKPLFSEDPQILNDNIAFKPIEFNAPIFVDEPVTKADEQVAVVESSKPEVPLESQPVLESFTPIEVPAFVPESVAEEKTEIVEERPVLDSMTPVTRGDEIGMQFDARLPPTEEKVAPVMDSLTAVDPVESVVPVEPVAPVAPAAPVMNTFSVPKEIKSEHSKPGFVYYVLLLILIGLSVFTLWLYQKNMTSDTAPVLTTTVSDVADTSDTAKLGVKSKVVESESVFLTDAPESKQMVEEIESDEDVAPFDALGSEDVRESVDAAPVVIDAVPGRLNTSGLDADEEVSVISEEDILANKPVYEPGAKHDNMFIHEGDNVREGSVKNVTVQENIIEEPVFIESGEYDDYFFDAEEAAYQAEMQQ